MMLVSHLGVLFAFVAHSFAAADPLITPAAQLAPRAMTDPLLVGYITTDGSYSDVRSCDYSETISSSGSYFQCCPTSGSCNFYTSCSSNTLLAAGTSVSCDYDSTVTCNTAVVLPTAGAQNGVSYLACWQTSLGDSPFTFVQDIGSATAAGPTTGSSQTSSSSSSGASRTPTSNRGSSSTTSSVSSTSSSPNPAPRAADIGSGAAGVVALLAQMLL